MSGFHRAVLVLVGAWGLGVLDWHAATLPDPRSDAVPQLMIAFRESAALVPATGTLAYVSPSVPTLSDGDIRFIAQYALAPRLLTDDVTNQRIAIAPPGLDAERHVQMLAGGWTSGDPLPGGVRVYRR